MWAEEPKREKNNRVRQVYGMSAMRNAMVRDKVGEGACSAVEVGGMMRQDFLEKL